MRLAQVEILLVSANVSIDALTVIGDDQRNDSGVTAAMSPLLRPLATESLEGCPNSVLANRAAHGSPHVPKSCGLETALKERLGLSRTFS